MSAARTSRTPPTGRRSRAAVPLPLCPRTGKRAATRVRHAPERLPEHLAPLRDLAHAHQKTCRPCGQGIRAA